MFKKFDENTNIASVNNAKNSVTKGVRNRVLELYPHSESYIDQIIPKKDGLKLIKCHEHIELYADSQGDVLFFKQRDGNMYPSLKTLHKYPFMLPHMQVDKGAIKHVVNGSNVMCPGLTSSGARMSDVPKDAIVSVMAEGKEHALAIGIAKMSSRDILSENKGIGIDTVHYVSDGLWNIKAVKKLIKV